MKLSIKCIAFTKIPLLQIDQYFLCVRLQSMFYNSFKGFMKVMTKQFDAEVSNAIGNYVYRLIDPRNGETFYVGKGTGDRVFQHVNSELKLGENEDEASEKLSRIREIRNEGLKVLHVIHRHGIPKEAVFEVEAALIDAYPGLSNDQRGHGCNDRGSMNVAQIIDKYGLPKLEKNPPYKLVLININSIQDRSTKQLILDQVRYAWRISKKKAEKADYVLAVLRGVVIGAFIAEKWLPATYENFPVLGREEIPSRHGFHGRPADDDVWEYFVGERGKRIENAAMKHYQFPIRYYNID